MRGIVGSAIAAIASPSAKATPISDQLWAYFTGGYSSKSGASVNVDSSLQVAAVLACARVLAEGVAQIPLKLYREDKTGDTKKLAKDDPRYNLLWRRPNDWMTSFEFRETLMFHAVLSHGGYAYINELNGVARELLPIMPGMIAATQSADYELTYTIQPDAGKPIVVPRSKILCVRGPSWNGYRGMEVISLAREAIGLSMTLEESQARFASNGSRPGGVLSVDPTATDTTRQRLKAGWDEAFKGSENQFKTAVLDFAVKWQPMAFSGVDSQHLESRKNQIEEVCRAFRVFPQMIGFADKTATYASAEQFFLAHVIHSLAPWVERWEQCLTRDLFAGRNDVDLTPKFSVQGLLRGDAKSRAEYYASGIVNGWLVRNEARRLEDLDPIPGLDQPLVPLNMGTQAERDALATDVTKAVKEMLGLAGAALDDKDLELKIGRVLSAVNEKRIGKARDLLTEVLDQLAVTAGE